MWSKKVRSKRLGGECTRVHILKHSGTDEVRLHTREEQADLVCRDILQCVRAGLVREGGYDTRKGEIA